MILAPAHRVLSIRLTAVTLGVAVSFFGCTQQPSRDEHAAAIGTAATGRETDAKDKAVRVLGTLPRFTLTDQRGEEFGTDDLKGKVWIATFIFTRCGATCPAQTTKFRSLQNELSNHAAWDDIHLISFTVDPNYDTPQVLQEYAQDAGADEAHWTFLTGPRREMWELSKEGFKLPVYDAVDNAASLITHSQRFVLVDGEGRIRGYYDGLLDEDVEDLKRHLELILTEDRSDPS